MAAESRPPDEAPRGGEQPPPESRPGAEQATSAEDASAIAAQLTDPSQVQQLDPAEVAQLAQRVIAQQTMVQVALPFPPPDWLDGYNRVLPDGADRVVSMTERQAAHRQWLERYGLIFGFLVVVIIAGGGIGLLFAKRDVGGLIALVGTLVTLAGLFILREWRRPSGRTQTQPRQ